MSAVRGRVRDGKVELDTALPEGADVVVLPDAAGETFDFAEPEVLELARRVEAAKRGEGVPAAQAPAGLRSRQ
jgi:hypothetical protein